MLDCHTVHIACKFAKLKEEIYHCSGEKLEDGPKLLKFGDAAIVDMVPGQPMCFKQFSDSRPLGLFAACHMKPTVAVGSSKQWTRRQAGAARSPSLPRNLRKAK